MQTKNKKIDLKKPELEACYHCGDDCPDSGIAIGEKIFCCNGCKLVYELLSEKDLCAYYTLDQNPGISPKEAGITTKYGYLDDPSVVKQLISFSDGNRSQVTFTTPDMHCSSCIWLLENLYRVNDGIIESKVNFLRKEVSVNFNNSKVSLREIVELLTSVGYEPEINLASLNREVRNESNKQLYLKIGVAGFAFGNIMLLSFPEYLSGDEVIDPRFTFFFGILNIVLALPVFFYSSMDYFKSAWQGLRQKYINMDVPISLGILALFLRSFMEIITQSGVGFFDSFTGLVFLLLVGKIFQKKTYDSLSFDRDYRSYFPVSVLRKTKDGEESVLINKIKPYDRILVRNGELIPADAVMIKGKGYIDYSFVTGESDPVSKISGDLIYAGGRQIGEMIELEVVKDVSQSYLTQLWNNEEFKKSEDHSITSIANQISKYFTITVISIAVLAAAYWLRTDFYRALNAFTSVLIIACPCALALSTPFTLGNTLRIFGKNTFYLKNTFIIEALAKIQYIIFDKTGTITKSRSADIEFIPDANTSQTLSESELIQIKSLVTQSTHPLSQHLTAHITGITAQAVDHFKEHAGLGIEGSVQGGDLRIGSAKFTGSEIEKGIAPLSSRVFVQFNNTNRGYFKISNKYRPKLKHIINQLGEKYDIALLTGDNESERINLQKYFKSIVNMRFNQTPFDKLKFVNKRQSEGKKVLMIGDGLNDAGALNSSDVGITISEDVNTFSPGSDGILNAQAFIKLPDFLQFAKISMNIIRVSFVISFLYNIIGLSFAVHGTLSPLFAAILMPISSVSVIAFTTGMTTLFARKLGFSLKSKL
jgi:P-type Cu+ transporter